MEFPFFAPAGAPNQLGYILTIGLLRHPAIKQFAAEVRAREGIEPPVDEHDLASNLEDHPPEQFEEEAFEHVKQLWSGWVASFNAQSQATRPFGEKEMEVMGAMAALDNDSPMPHLIMEFAQPDKQSPSAGAGRRRHK